MESRKIVLMTVFVGQQWICRCEEQTLRTRVGWGEEGKGEMNGESSMDANTLPYVK